MGTLLKVRIHGFWLISFFMLCFSLASGVQAKSWETETVDSSDNVGMYTSIALDPWGKVHISYYDTGSSDLKYVTNESGSWEDEVVEESADIVGKWSSIAVDSSGNAHISYYDDSNDDLRYATNKDGTAEEPWEYEKVDSKGGVDVGEYTSIAVDSSGDVHISYYDDSNDDLRYATNKDGTVQAPWKDELVDGDGDGEDEAKPRVGEYTSIALDSSGNAHISYYDDSNDALKYATNESGLWKDETVDDSSSFVGQWSAIAVDSFGNVHISYYDGDSNNEYLKYATNKDGTEEEPWKHEPADSTNNVGRYTSIAVDSSGNAHISYYDVGNAHLKYATNESGSWQSETVDSSDDVGKWSSIAVDKDSSDEPVHISYFYDSVSIDDHLKYAHEVTDGNGNGESEDADVFFNCFISTLTRDAWLKPCVRSLRQILRPARASRW